MVEATTNPEVLEEKPTSTIPVVEKEPKEDSSSLDKAYLNNLTKIIGRPHRWPSYDDVSGRVFFDHMLAYAPIVSFRPGTIILNRTGDKAKDLIEAIEKENQKGYSLPQSVINELQKQIQSKTVSSNFTRLASGDDSFGLSSLSTRFQEFAPLPKEYLDVVSTLSGKLLSGITRKSSSAWSKQKKTGDGKESGTGGLAQMWDTVSREKMATSGFWSFWADNSSTVSESLSSDVGPTLLQQISSQLGDVSQMVQSAFGLSPDAENAVAYNNQGIISTTWQAVLGNRNLLPEKWNNSSFGRDYQISFKFYSPYGSPEAIYENVLLPFSMLMALALPRQTSLNSYTSPFIFQMDCPGYFSCDCGIVTSFSFTKGGSEGLWTVDNLPKAIDVTMAVKDLYPSLMSNSSPQALLANIGMTTFLDNLCSIPLRYSGTNRSFKGEVLQAVKTFKDFAPAGKELLRGGWEKITDQFSDEKAGDLY